MVIPTIRVAIRNLLSAAVPVLLVAAATPAGAAAPEVPDWAQPGSATHQQVPPPADFHRATRTEAAALGAFEGQSDIGGAVVAGSSIYDPLSRRYTINSAGYNIWYTRDEFRYLWKKVSGDVSLAATVSFPNPDGYLDRKAVFVIRQGLEDDAREIMSALHGGGLIHLALRPDQGANITEAHRIPAPAAGQAPNRIGIEKHGDLVTLWVGRPGEPMQRVGEPVKIQFDEPFYVGIGFCSHLPATSDTTVLSDVVLENSAGKVR